MKVPPLLLASTSPRRHELLRRHGIPFEVVVPTALELGQRDAPHFTPGELALFNASRKAFSVAHPRLASWIIGADIVVVIGDRILGKPRDRNEAVEMLSLLSGKRHRVLTAVVCVRPHRGSPIAFVETTWVQFKKLSDTVISQYVDEVHVLDKAGSYAAQEGGERIIASIRGSLSNVIGLPVEALLAVLQGNFELHADLDS